jgi:hypothetical protein
VSRWKALVRKGPPSTQAHHHPDPSELCHSRGLICLGSLAHIATLVTFCDGKPRFGRHAPFPRRSQMPYPEIPAQPFLTPVFALFSIISSSPCVLVLTPYCSTFRRSKSHTSENGTCYYNSPCGGGEAPSPALLGPGSSV